MDLFRGRDRLVELTNNCLIKHNKLLGLPSSDRLCIISWNGQDLAESMSKTGYWESIHCYTGIGEALYCNRQSNTNKKVLYHKADFASKPRPERSMKFMLLDMASEGSSTARIKILAKLAGGHMLVWMRKHDLKDIKRLLSGCQVPAHGILATEGDAILVAARYKGEVSDGEANASGGDPNS